jgi:hypothetical protein
MTAFPPCFAVIVVMTVSWLADKYRVRGLPVIGQGLLGIVGLCMTGFLDTPTPRYVGTFLGYAGAVGLVVTSMSWMANNLRGDGKRAVATAIMISISGVGGIYSSLVFRQQVRHISSFCKVKRALTGIFNRTHPITFPGSLLSWQLTVLRSFSLSCHW